MCTDDIPPRRAAEPAPVSRRGLLTRGAGAALAAPALAPLPLAALTLAPPRPDPQGRIALPLPGGAVLTLTTS